MSIEAPIRRKRRRAADGQATIKGGVPLEGDVKISGSKNASLPILAGALLASEPVTICNVPHLKDVTTTLQLPTRMGATVTVDERSGIEVDGSDAEKTRPRRMSS